MRMTNKRIHSGFPFLIALVVLVSASCIKNTPYCVNVFNSAGGWGYDVKYNNKLIIHQPYMPVVSGHTPFSNKLFAEKTAWLVVKKLEYKKSPTITREELLSIEERTRNADERR
jgi:hypothetical protein